MARLGRGYGLVDRLGKGRRVIVRCGKRGFSHAGSLAQAVADAATCSSAGRVEAQAAGRTRDEHEQRLQILAGVVAAANDDWQRQIQLHRQFRKAADRFGLAQGKRTGLLNAAAWARRSNAEPTMADL